ncbi:hypothetical protein V8B55DRAFT_1457566 [Mucor lusitanicus]|uniref:Uncharacterized protein n=2 Tax=Mucor circinelloides f. lusitanicus TaxID=29924 RepID=A0A168KAM4_MUCCL|nr:hypothetical protein FB192DRAFT_1350938 [Mucor lusitanicus]OAD02181.1 hypothetical protein MUCCIDRAFT_111544 [Mucor lusitanicus CBS 277.49]
MRLTIISLAIIITAASSYSVEASSMDATHHIEGSASGAVSRLVGSHENAVPAVVSKLERRSFTSRSRAITRAKLQRRNGSLLPDIVLPSISSAQSSAPAVARPIPQAVSYPVAAAAAPVAQNYYTPQPATQGYTAPQQVGALQNYTPQQLQQAAAAAAAPNYYTPQVQQPAATVPATPKLTLPTLIRPPKEKEDDNDDSDDEDEEDEDEEDEEDYDADDLVTRRRRR